MKNKIHKTNKYKLPHEREMSRFEMYADIAIGVIALIMVVIGVIPWK